LVFCILVLQGCLQLLNLLFLALHAALLLQHLLMCLKHLPTDHVFLGLQAGEQHTHTLSIKWWTAMVLNVQTSLGEHGCQCAKGMPTTALTPPWLAAREVRQVFARGAPTHAALLQQHHLPQ
jgi:hypothetical protein